ncbi:unnamed protein product [Paramecium octaurelia]|uniref:Uncharacterized protein n=1 Tax=Paramecium octaurelia TaxID=43137 RepID=A0A8S1UG29_PAROT|nr:unnamed protein product [Paramecium octaurelia]
MLKEGCFWQIKTNQFYERLTKKKMESEKIEQDMIKRNFHLQKNISFFLTQTENDQQN